MSFVKRKYKYLAKLSLSFAVITSVLACSSAQVPWHSNVQSKNQHPWMDSALAPNKRAKMLVDAMSLEQKMQQLVGTPPEIVPELPHCFGGRHVRGIPELAIPTLRVTNGPVGIGQNDCVDLSIIDEFSTNPYAPYSSSSSAKATALPSAMGVAASFDPNVAAQFGKVLADEANAMALQVLEAPGMNLARIPVLGRNFEYKGEDPYLAGVISVAEIRAIQAQGVIAMAKHFAANEQETNRTNIAQNIDEQVLRELYLLPFEMSVKEGHVASIMCSYNDLNGQQACENNYLMTKVLRDDWGFKGYVQSDFWAVKSTAPSMLAGLDHLMPVPSPWSPKQLKEALATGELTLEHLDTALARRYMQMFKMGIFEKPIKQMPLDVKAGGRAARDIGVKSAVLLQNNGALPFSTQVNSVVIIGKKSQVYAQQAVTGGVMVGKPMGAGGGSSDVVPHYTVSPLAGIKTLLQQQGNLNANVELILVDDDNSDLPTAIKAAKAADAVVIMAGSVSEEGADRATFANEHGVGSVVTMGDSLDWYTPKPNMLTSVTGSFRGNPTNVEKNSQTLAMIKGIMGSSPKMAQKTALVLKDNASIALPNTSWLLGKSGPAILETWFAGQEDGAIGAALLFGLHNPAGKLPVTFPIQGKGFLDEIANDPVSYPGILVDGKPTVTYKEGLNIGYRWYDANLSGACAIGPTGNNPCIAFPFGFGLSYTKFERSSASLREHNGLYHVALTVKNTGKRKGAEVIQVYAGIPSAEQPPKRLVGFEKVELEPGESKLVMIVIDPKASHHPLSTYDTALEQFVVAKGAFELFVGNSSAPANLERLDFKR